MESAQTAHQAFLRTKTFGALDGLRALAIFAVVLYHVLEARAGLVGRFYLSVSLFFSISGFLITTLLLAEAGRTGRIDLRAFWVRRALRLLPALLVMVALTVPLMLTTLRDTVLLPPELAVLASLFYVANWANVAVDVGTGPPRAGQQRLRLFHRAARRRRR